MSLAHIRLVKARESNDKVIYIAESPDFNDGRTWEAVAEIAISKASGHPFTFTPLNYWATQRVVPPETYELPVAERTARLAGPLAGYGFGAWTGRILSLIRLASKDAVFPDNAP